MVPLGRGGLNRGRIWVARQIENGQRGT